MRERSDLLGGQLSVQSSPADGTTISATFPITRRRRKPGLAPTPMASDG